MTLKTNTSTSLQPPVVSLTLPTLSFNPVTTVSSSSPTILDSAASVAFNGNNANRFIQVSLGKQGGKLGILNGTTLSATGTESGIAYSYSASTQVLTLTGSGSSTDAGFTALLKKIAFDATGSSLTGQSISVNLGRPVYDAANGHYYEFVPFTPGQTNSWTSSKASAATRDLFGLTGYLATVNTAQENEFMTKSFASKGWIAGVSTISNGTRTWKWDAGPEQGTTFWTENVSVPGQITNGATSTYANWASGEPNNYKDGINSPGGNNEGYAHFLLNGKWNDLANIAGADQQDQYRPDGYWVEYSTADGTNSLAGTRKNFNVTITDGSVTGKQDPAALDLVFYDAVNGVVSFAFVGADNNIVKAGLDLTGDTPKLVLNSTGNTRADGNQIQLISANVDVDRDGNKDLIIRNTVSGRASVVFGESRTGSETGRQYAYARVATITFPNGTPIDLPSYSIDFASNTIGVGNTPGVFWRSGATGDSGVHTLSLSTDKNGNPIVISKLAGNAFQLGANSGWRAIGDGEFNDNTASREILWVNDITTLTYSWSMPTERNTVSGKFLKLDSATSLFVPTNIWRLIGINNVNSSGNDEVVWQNVGGTVVIWKMADAQLSGYDVIGLSQTERLKVVANTELATGGATEILEFVGQNDVDGTVGYYKVKFTDSPTGGKYALEGVRRTYTLGNGTYRPGKGAGAGLELVNVGQYDKLIPVPA
jgi:hypothetical protein